MFERIRKIEDCRKKSEYELLELIMAYIVMSTTKSDSRNAFNNDRQERNFKSNNQYLRQIEFKPKSDFSDPIKSICYDYSINCFYFIFKIGEGIVYQ